MASELDLVQGTLDLLVLRALVWGPQHGYAVARWIHTSSGDALAVEDRALYVSLHRLEERGYVASEWGVSENNRKAKFYDLTSSGRRQLRQETTRWTRYSQAIARVLQAAPVGAAT